MRPVRTIRTIATALMVTCSAGFLAAQDTTMMKKDAMHDTTMMKKDAMGKEKMEHGMMMDHPMGQHGMFSGAHDHKVSGNYTVAEQDGKQILTLGPDFSLDGAPDPYVVLSGNDMGSGAGTLNLGALKHKRGPVSFVVPAGTDLAKYSHVLVWCKKYNVTLGQAELAAADRMMHN